MEGGGGAWGYATDSLCFLVGVKQYTDKNDRNDRTGRGHLVVITHHGRDRSSEAP